MHLPHIQPFGNNPLYFFTACIEGRRSILACSSAFEELNGLWSRSAKLDGWFVGRFVLMPDHVHFFAVSRQASKPRDDWHKMWKSVSARRLMREFGLQAPVWQSGTFDHILRNRRSYAEKWHYVRENPVRRGLVTQAEDWPWQGEINILSVD